MKPVIRDISLKQMLNVKKKMFSLHSDLPFLPEREKIEKFEELVCNIKKKNVVHIRALKQALNHGLTLKGVHRVIEFHQEAWLKPQIHINTKLTTVAKNEFEKDFFKLMNNMVLGKTMENVCYRYIIMYIIVQIYYISNNRQEKKQISFRT